MSFYLHPLNPDLGVHLSMLILSSQQSYRYHSAEIHRAMHAHGPDLQPVLHFHGELLMHLLIVVNSHFDLCYVAQHHFVDVFHLTRFLHPTSPGLFGSYRVVSTR